MSFDEDATSNVFYLAGGGDHRRHVRTPEGSRKYGLPIGALITRDAELRAKLRFPGTSVPEDADRRGGGQSDGKIGQNAVKYPYRNPDSPKQVGNAQQTPQTPEHRRNAQELAKVIAASPEVTNPVLITPTGDQHVDVGGHTYNFPSGSRVYRSREHDDWALVRTPQYNFVLATKDGNAVDLSPETEQALNERFDAIDEEDPEFSVEIAGQTPEDTSPGVDTPTATPDAGGTTPTPNADGLARYERAEDVPGYQSEELMQANLEGLRRAGLGDNALHLVERQLRDSNDALRQRWEADRAGSDSGNEAAPVDAPTDVPATDPADEKLWQAAKDKMAPAPSAAPAAAPQKPAADAKPANHDGDLSALESKTRERPSGVAEGPVGKQNVAVRRNRQTDSMEYTVGDGPDAQTFRDRQQAIDHAAKRDAETPDPTPAQPERPAAGQTVTLADGRRGIVVGDGSDENHLRVHTGLRGVRDEPVDGMNVVRRKEDPEASKLIAQYEELNTGRVPNARQVDRLNGKIDDIVRDDSRDDVTDAELDSPDKADAPDFESMSPAKLKAYRADATNPREHREAARRAEKRLARSKPAPRRAADGEARDTAKSIGRRSMPPRDTADLAPGQLTDAELDDVIADYELAERRDRLAFPGSARGRLNDLVAERLSRQSADRQKDAPEQTAPPTVQDYVENMEVFGPRVTNAEDLIDNAHVGDIYAGFGPGRHSVGMWEVQQNGRVRLIDGPGVTGNVEHNLDHFADSVNRPHMGGTEYGRMHAWSNNERNTERPTITSRPDRISNEPTDYRFSEADLAVMGVRNREGDFTRQPEREDILNSKTGDVFLTQHGRTGQRTLWQMGEDGQIHSISNGAQFSMAREQFATMDVTHDIRSFSGNEHNSSKQPDLRPGDATTRDWAESAAPGAAAYSGDGVVREKNADGTWETPMGTVDDTHFAPSDVENDDAVVVRNSSELDGRPVGATRQIESFSDLGEVHLGDSVDIVFGEHSGMHATRKSDGSWDVHLSSGLHMPVSDDQTLYDMAQGQPVWHVPNQNLEGTPSRRSWNAGDPIKSVDDILAQKPGTRLRYGFRRPRPDGTDHSTYVVLPDGQIQREGSPNVYPHDLIDNAVRAGRVSVLDVPEADAPEPDAPEPHVVENLADYHVGDAISSHRHLRDMEPGQQVTLVIPASENGGRSATVVLTRTNDENDHGGFMFLVGRRGAGYNAFGENNANLFQAIFDGNLYFGDITRPDDADAPQYMEGDWSKERNIKLWDDGPMVSEHDLRTFIDAQVYSRAMQGSYYNVDLLPPGNPFRSAELRAKFAELAIAEYSTPGNPARHKPAMIRYAAKKLGLEYTDPGSELLPDNLDISDFRKRVTIGRWARRNGSAERPAEANMGPEQLDVSKADIKVALSIIDNMLVPTDSHEDPDKILKRVMAMRGSPLQSLNTSVAIASYYGMRRYRDGALTNHIARQHDKTRNKALLRQMLLEQMEGRAPGYYGLPEDETYERGGHTFINRSTLSRPAIHSDNDPARAVAAAPEAAAPAPEATAPDAPNVSANGISLDGWRATNITTSERTPARGTRGRPVTRFNTESLREIQNAPEGLLRVTYNNDEDPSGPTDRTLKWDPESRSFRDIDTARLFSQEEVASWAMLHGYEFYVQDGSSALPDTDGNGRTADMSPDMPATAPDRATLNAEPTTPRPSYTTPAPEGSGTSPEPSRPLTLEQMLLMPVGSRVRIEADGQSRWMNAHVIRDEVSGEHALQMDGGRRVIHDMTEERMQRAMDGGNSFHAITGDLGGTSVSLQEVIDAPPGTEFMFRDDRGVEVRTHIREDGQLDNVEGGGSGWDRDPVTLGGFGGSFHRVGDPSETNPDSGNEQAHEITSDGEMANVPEGTRVRVTTRDGIVREGVVETDADGTRLIRVDANTSYRISDGHFSALRNSLGYRFESLPASAAPARDPRFQPGGTFRGQDIREVPVGAHVRGASGTEYEVTDSGIRGIDGYPTHSFAVVENHNAQFEYLGDSAPTTVASVGSGNGLTVGGAVTPQNLMRVPDGHWVRWGSGGMWYRRGNLLHSESGDRVRWVNRVPRTANFTYLGDRNGAPGAARPATRRTRVERPSAGSWERVTPEKQARYDRPRALPSINFSEDDTHLSSYLDTDEGRSDLRHGIEEALRLAGEANPTVNVSGGGSYFRVSYTTSRGSTVLQRSIRGDLVENAQANSSGGYMAQTQDALFDFYRRHGIEEVEVHGLTSSGWNGGHTWIRRGFRPSLNASHERMNFDAFQSHTNHLERIIGEIESGRHPHYNEFLEEAKELHQQMRQLISEFWQLPQSERNNRLYELQRAVSYLGEVRDGNGKTRRQPPSIGWRLMGDSSRGGTHNGGSFWYYGRITLDDYFNG